MSMSKFLNKGARYFRRAFSVPNTLAKLQERLATIESKVQFGPSTTGGAPSPELQVYPGYAPADALLFNEFALAPATPQPGFIIDFLGVRTRTASLFDTAKALDGQILGIPVPSDYHAEAVEWLGLLKSVKAAHGEYVAMELGAGWGPWLISGGAAARQKGIRTVRLCGVEGDQNHYDSMCQHFTDNGFNPQDHSLILAAVGVENGTARWPVVADPGNEWGLRPTGQEGEDAADRDLTAALGKRMSSFIDVKVIALGELLAREPRWDLVHVDIQGGETKVLDAFRQELNQRVRYLIVGTHSRKIDGELIEIFHQEGWILEHEKPCRMIYNPDAADLVAMTIVDGTQVWRNPRVA